MMTSTTDGCILGQFPIPGYPMVISQAEHNQFEDTVRQVARLLWIDAALSGSLELEGRERDGVFETRDTVHIVEATVSTKKEKADDDAKKTAQTVQHIRGAGGKFAQGWLITKGEPTVEQKKAVEKYRHSVRLLSFEQFRSTLFNGAEYLRCRAAATFGSISDPINRETRLDRGAYVPMDIFEAGGRSHSAAGIAAEILTSCYRGVLVGDYGAGKSMTLREIFYELSDEYNGLTTAKTPIYLNLREHRGQTDPVEALERHARQIGYSGGTSDLVRAWRAGHVNLLLDGFDEIATAGWGQSLKKVREHRFAAMALVRRFIQESSPSSSIIVVGRSNFFDSASEMDRALGINASWHHASLNDFTPRQVELLLKKLGYGDDIPEWLPSRPLIVAYFAILGRAENIKTELVGLTAGAGWNKFLDLISEREARQDERLDPETVRSIIERLATKARATTDGMGRLSIDMVQDAYREIVGLLPDEGGQQLLLRLPGLASSSAEDGTRAFIDPQFSSAARAGDILRFIKDPFNFQTQIFSEIQSPLGSSGKEVLQHNRSAGDITDGNLKGAFESLRGKDHPPQLAMDITSSALSMFDGEFVGDLMIRDAIEDELVIGDADNSKLTFADCIITSISLDDNSVRANLPTFTDCIIGVVEGLGSSEALPEQLRSSDVSTANSGTTTNAEIMGLSTSEPVKVLLTVVKKLFIQKGSGRQVAAFSRGMDARAAKFVPDVLELIQRSGLAAPSRVRGTDVWRPNRAMTGRVKKILSAPLLSDDPILKLAKEL